MPTPAPADTQGNRIDMQLSSRTLTVGQPARASGRLGADLAGRTVVLEFRPRGGAWTALASGTVDGRGHYALARALPRSGALRVVLQPASGAATAASEPPRSVELPVAVTPRVGVARARMHVKAGSRATVAGRVAQGGGFRIRLQVRDRGRWHTLDRSRTNAAGRFVLRDRVRRTLSVPARVVVGARNGLAASRRPIGRLNVYRVALASWYGPGFYGRKTGCGGRLGTAQLGVAHKTLPCGTRVTLRYRGRTLRVPVIDRGPYAGAREYDLTAATARRLGFRGHGAILSTR